MSECAIGEISCRFYRVGRQGCGDSSTCFTRARRLTLMDFTCKHMLIDKDARTLRQFGSSSFRFDRDLDASSVKLSQTACKWILQFRRKPSPYPASPGELRCGSFFGSVSNGLARSRNLGSQWVIDEVDAVQTTGGRLASKVDVDRRELLACALQIIFGRPCRPAAKKFIQTTTQQFQPFHARKERFHYHWLCGCGRNLSCS